MKNSIVRMVFLIAIVCCWQLNAFAQTEGALSQSQQQENRDATEKPDALVTTTATNASALTPVQEEGASNASSGSSMYIGFRYMPTFTSLDFHQTEGGALETTMVLGHGFGGLIGVNVSDHVGLQGEVIYSLLNQKYKDPQAIEWKVSLNYINVPLLMVLNTNSSSPVNLNFCFGPQFGFNTGSKLESSGSNGLDTIHAVLAVKPADFGFAYGAGLDFGTGNLKFNVGFRGVYGLIDISDQSQSTTTSEYYILDRAHVKTYSGYVGLTFGF